MLNQIYFQLTTPSFSYPELRLSSISGDPFVQKISELKPDEQRQMIDVLLERFNVKEEQFQIMEREVANLEFARKNSDRQINTLLANHQVDYQISSKRAIIDQPSIFLAPEIYGTEEINKKTRSAIPFFGLFPDGKTTKCLINLSQNFFGLTALIAFSYDKISEDDVEALSAELSSRSENFIGKSFAGYDLKLSRLSSLLTGLKQFYQSKEDIML